MVRFRDLIPGGEWWNSPTIAIPAGAEASEAARLGHRASNSRAADRFPSGAQHVVGYANA